MSTEVVIKAKEQLARWRKDFLENHSELKNFIVESNEELLSELSEFNDCETDYIVRLAEANLKRIVASFDQNGIMDGLVYDFDNQYLLIYFEENAYKWSTKSELDDCYEFFIEKKNEKLN